MIWGWGWGWLTLDDCFTVMWGHRLPLHLRFKQGMQEAWPHLLSQVSKLYCEPASDSSSPWISSVGEQVVYILCKHIQGRSINIILHLIMVLSINLRPHCVNIRRFFHINHSSFKSSCLTCHYAHTGTHKCRSGEYCGCWFEMFSTCKLHQHPGEKHPRATLSCLLAS